MASLHLSHMWFEAHGMLLASISLLPFRPMYVPPAAIQLQTKYPPILATRSLPYNKDKHALTNAALATLSNVCSRVMPNAFAIIPVPQYHAALEAHRKIRNNVTKFLVHPDQDDEARAIPEEHHKWVLEITYEVIYVGTEEGRDNGQDSLKYQDSKKALYEELAKARRDQQELDPPFLAYVEGLLFEYTHSFAHFRDCPRGPPGALTPNATVVRYISPQMLARDALNILAQDPANTSIIKKTRSAVVAPPVPAAKQQDCWRLFLIGDLTRETLHYDVLESHMRSYYKPDTTLNSFAGPVYGLDTYTMLREMYDRYWSRQDGNLNTGNSAPLVLGPCSMAPSVPSQPQRSAWTAPTSTTSQSLAAFPPLGSSTALARHVHTHPAAGEQSMTVAFQQHLDTYVQKIVAQEIQTIRKETSDALDAIHAKATSIQAQTDTALASIDQKLDQQESKLAERITVATLRARVDPINRGLDAIRTRQSGLLALRRERKKLDSRAPSADKEELDNLIHAEFEGINAAAKKIRQRYEALVDEATARGIELEDLDPINF